METNKIKNTTDSIQNETVITPENATLEQEKKVHKKSGHRKEKEVRDARIAQSIADKIKHRLKLGLPEKDVVLSPVEKAKAKAEMLKANADAMADRILSKAIAKEEADEKFKERLAEINAKLVANGSHYIDNNGKIKKTKVINKDKIAKKIEIFNIAKLNKTIPSINLHTSLVKDVEKCKGNHNNKLWLKRRKQVIDQIKSNKPVDLTKYWAKRDEMIKVEKERKIAKKMLATKLIIEKYGDHAFDGVRTSPKIKKQLIAKTINLLKMTNALAAKEENAKRLQRIQNEKSKTDFDKLSKDEQVALKVKEEAKKKKQQVLEESKTKRKIDRIVNKDLQILSMLKSRAEALKHFNKQEELRAEKRELKALKYSTKMRIAAKSKNVA